MSVLAKNCIKVGRRDSHSTADFIELFGGDLNVNGAVEHYNKDQLVVIMANIIMELTSRGKFNLRDY